MRNADAGLRAVLRVREAKEQEAQLGLVHAAAEERRRAEHAGAVRAVLDRVQQPDQQSGGAFVALQLALSATGDQVTAADRETEIAGAVTGQARVALAAASQQTSMVQMLLERRELERRAERRRAEAKQLDEFAQTAWLRRRQA